MSLWCGFFSDLHSSSYILFRLKEEHRMLVLVPPGAVFFEVLSIITSQDASVYELIHDLLGGRVLSEDIEPLKVVVDGSGVLHIVRGHRRSLALSSLQGMWRHRTVWAPCLLYDVEDPEVAREFQANKDTTVDGLGIEVHYARQNYRAEAWHMGKPLFRVDDGSATMSTGHTDTSQVVESERASSPSKELIGKSMLVQVGRPRFGEVVDIDESHVKVSYWWPPWFQDEWISTDRVQVPDYSSLQPGKKVTVWWQNTPYSCQVLEVSQSKERLCQPVHVRYNSDSSDEWVGLDRLQTGQVQLFPWKDVADGAVTTSSFPSASSWPRDVEDGYAAGSLNTSRQPETTFVCCMWLRGKCGQYGQHFMGRNLYLHEDVPGLHCGFGSACRHGHMARSSFVPEERIRSFGELESGMIVKVNSRGTWHFGEIIDMSQFPDQDPVPVQVRYKAHADSQAAWFSLENLQVPDFSKVEEGMQGAVVDASSGKYFACTVLQVSTDKERTQAPVYVHYEGYSADHDEWVGVDRFRCNELHFRRARLPLMGAVNSQAPASLPCAADAQKTAPSSGVEEQASSSLVKVEREAVTSTLCSEMSVWHNKNDSKGADEQVELQRGMILQVNCRGSWMCGEVLAISQLSDRDPLPVKVRYKARDQRGWSQVGFFALGNLRVPDFSDIQGGMEGSVEALLSGQHFACTVVQVSRDPNHAETPVQVHYDGYPAKYDEWVGADRFQCESVRFLQCKLPTACTSAVASREGQQSMAPSREVAQNKSALVDHNTLPCPEAEAAYSEKPGVGELHWCQDGSQNEWAKSDQGKHYEWKGTAEEVLQSGMIVQVNCRGSWMCGEVCEISQLSDRDPLPVRVCYKTRDGSQTEWFSLDNVRIPDFSEFEKGMQGVANVGNDQEFPCTVLQVSHDRIEAPLYVHYDGYPARYDEWVGADSFRSLKFLRPQLPCRQGLFQ